MNPASPVEADGASLKDRAVSGIAFSMFARIGQQGLQFAVAVLLARLLLPQDYGIIGMIAVFTGFAAMFAEFGFGSALVQRPELDETHLHSIFWVNQAFGLTLTGLFYFAAPALADFYSIPQLAEVGRALSVSFTIGALAIVPEAILQRRMRYKALAQLEIWAALISGLVAVALALRGAGVWSLVAQSLLSAALTGALACYLSGWTPRLVFSARAVRDLLGFSSNLVGFSMVNYWARNLDNLLVGKIIGSAGLGVYTRAYGLMLLPVSQVIAVISRVMFPTLSAIQADRPRVKQIYLRAVRMIALITFPLMVGLYTVTEPFVLTLLGAQWSGVIPILQILCAVGILQSLCSPVGWIYTSQGRTDWMFWWGIAGSGTLVVGIVAGASFGTVEAVAWGYLVANIVTFYPCIMIPGKLIGLTVGEVVKSVRLSLFCALLMGAAVLLLARALPSGWPEWLRLAVLVGTGALSYSALLVLFRPAAFDELQGLFLERLRRRSLEVQPV